MWTPAFLLFINASVDVDDDDDEDDDVDGDAIAGQEGELQLEKHRSLNKIGHALHYKYCQLSSSSP